jgi:hypothetical protein
MSEPIETKQLPVAYRYTYDNHSWHFLDSNSNYEFVSLVAKDIFAEPLYTHPQKELTDEEIVEVMCLGDKDLMLILELTPYAKEKMIQRGRAVLKKGVRNERIRII